MKHTQKNRRKWNITKKKNKKMEEKKSKKKEKQKVESAFINSNH